MALLSGRGIELTSKQERISSTWSCLPPTICGRPASLSISMTRWSRGLRGSRIVYYKGILKRRDSANRVCRRILSLQVLAVQSGGRVLNSSNDLTSEIAHCVSDGDAFYVSRSRPPGPDGQTNTMPSQITVDKLDFTARARTGYYPSPMPRKR